MLAQLVSVALTTSVKATDKPLKVMWSNSRHGSASSGSTTAPPKYDGHSSRFLTWVVAPEQLCQQEKSDPNQLSDTSCPNLESNP